MPGFSKTPHYFSFIFLDNISHKFWDQPPFTPLSMLLASIWDSFLLQALALLLFQHPATMSRGRGLVYFCKVDHSRISIFYSEIDLVSVIYVRYCRWDLIKDLQIVIKEGLGKIVWSLRSNPVVLLTLLRTFLYTFFKI